MLQVDQEILDKKYRIIEKIGSGAFGEIYKIEKTSNKQIFALKAESLNTDQKQIMLFWESKIIKLLKSRDVQSVFNVYFIGQEKSLEGVQVHVMVMDLLGPSLQDLFESNNNRLDLETTLNIGIQIIKIIKDIHSQGILYRDIKPENFLIGNHRSTQNQIFICDFGLAKYYMVSKNKKNPQESSKIKEYMAKLQMNEEEKNEEQKIQKEHIPLKDGKSLIGTPKYASLNSHQGLELSRRDDLESLAYMLIQFIQGSLPWSGVKAKTTQEKFMNIKYVKEMTSPEELCKGLPREFLEYLVYTRSLQFTDEPNYDMIYKLFVSCLHSNHLQENKLNFGYIKESLIDEKKQYKLKF